MDLTRVYPDPAEVEEAEGRKLVGNEVGGGKELGINPPLAVEALLTALTFGEVGGGVGTIGRGGYNLSLAAWKVTCSTGRSIPSSHEIKGKSEVVYETEDGKGRWITAFACGGGLGGIIPPCC